MGNNHVSYARRLVVLALFFLAGLVPSTVEGADLTPGQVESARQEQQNQLQHVQHVRGRLQEQHQVGKKLLLFPELKKILQRVHFHYGVFEGYDRNPNLSSPRKGSGFTEQDLGVGYVHRLGQRFIYRLTGNMRYVNYYKFADENLFEQTLRGEGAVELTPHFFVESEYAARWFWKPHDAQGDFIEQEVKTGLKHYLIPHRLYHKPSYIFQYREFTKAKARVSSGDPSTNGRHDTTHRLDYEIGVHPTQWLLFQIHNQYGRNDSNDQFFDFYDYTFYQVTPSVTWEITKPLFLVTGVQFQHNHYDDRAVHGSAERENFTAFFGSLFYHVTENASVGFHWVYAKDASNLPELEYQDSSLSLGVHVHF